MTFIDFVLHALAALPIVLALLLTRVANQPKTRRVRQFPMPVLSVVYAIVAMVVLYRSGAWLDGWLTWLMRLIPGIRDVYTSVWLYFLENVLVVLVFFVIKLVLKPIFAGAFHGPAFRGHRTVEGIYEWEADYELWMVRPTMANLRGLYRGFFWAAIVATVAYTACITTFPGWPGFVAVAYPPVVALVIGEFVSLLSGVTKDEYVSDILGEDDVATRLANYAPLRRILDSTFGGRVLAEGLSLSTSDASRSRSRIDRLVERPNNEMEALAGAYFQRLKAAGGDLDINLLDAAVGLLDKQSVVIANPFHGDLTPYLAFPAHYHLLQRRKVLIVAGREAASADYRDWIADGLEAITGIGDLWSVDILGGTPRDDLDVGVLRFADLHNVELLKQHDDFLAQVEYVILAEPSRLLATGQLGLGLVLQRVGRRGPVVYASFDRNHDGLVDALSHLLRVELADVVASALPTGATNEMVWQADGPSMHTAILPAITRYLGVGTEIAAVALKYQVERVSWVGADRFPVRDMTWLAGQYYPAINSFAELELTQAALEEAVVPVTSPWSVERAPRQFLVVEDEINNVFESLRLYATRAQTEGFVNLVSGDYLLRDYMVANREIFSADPKAIPSIVPDFARTERNGVLRLLLTMLAFDIDEADLEKQLQILGIPVPSATDDPAVAPAVFGEAKVVELFRELVRKHTGVGGIRIITERETDDSDHTVTRLRVEASDDLDSVLEHLRAAYFFVEDEQEDSSYIGALLYGHVYQAMLPGQFLTYAGKYYEVQSIGSANNRDGVVLRRAADHIRDRRVYKQIRTFALSDFEANPIVGSRLTVDRVEAAPHAAGQSHSSRVELARSFASISVSTDGYLEMPGRSALIQAYRIGLETDDVPKREYAHKEVLEIRLPEIDAATRRTIVEVLNEIFVSVFPNAYEYVTALTPDQRDEGGDLLDDLVVDGHDDSIFIVEDSLVDLGLVVAVERNWRRLLEIVTDYLLWRETPPPAEPEPPVAAEPEFPDAPPAPKKKRGLFATIGRIIRAVGRGIAWIFGSRRAPTAGVLVEPEVPAAEPAPAAATPAAAAEPPRAAAPDEQATADATPETAPAKRVPSRKRRPATSDPESIAPAEETEA